MAQKYKEIGMEHRTSVHPANVCGQNSRSRLEVKETALAWHYREVMPGWEL